MSFINRFPRVSEKASAGTYPAVYAIVPNFSFANQMLSITPAKTDAAYNTQVVKTLVLTPDLKEMPEAIEDPIEDDDAPKLVGEFVIRGFKNCISWLQTNSTLYTYGISNAARHIFWTFFENGFVLAAIEDPEFTHGNKSVEIEINIIVVLAMICADMHPVGEPVIHWHGCLKAWFARNKERYINMTPQDAYSLHIGRLAYRYFRQFRHGYSTLSFPDGVLNILLYSGKSGRFLSGGDVSEWACTFSPDPLVTIPSFTCSLGAYENANIHDGMSVPVMTLRDSVVTYANDKLEYSTAAVMKIAFKTYNASGFRFTEMPFHNCTHAHICVLRAIWYVCGSIGREVHKVLKAHDGVVDFTKWPATMHINLLKGTGAVDRFLWEEIDNVGLGIPDIVLRHYRKIVHGHRPFVRAQSLSTIIGEVPLLIMGDEIVTTQKAVSFFNWVHAGATIMYFTKDLSDRGTRVNLKL